MKIYISADMEGTAGISSWDEVDARTPTQNYALYRPYMTDEVCAAIDGARKAGAKEFLINDSHGPMRNILLDRLPEDARVIFGNRKPLSMMQDLSKEFAGAFFTGYHGAIGLQNATLCHTYTPSVVYNLRINGVTCSEATLNAAVAGYYGVPVLLITGDRSTVEGAQEQMPWITGAIVKESIGNYAVDSISPKAACTLIKEKAAEALAKRSEAKPYSFKAPIEMEIDVTRIEQADWIELIPGFTRSAPRTVRFTHEDFLVTFRAFVAAFRMGAVAGGPA